MMDALLRVVRKSPNAFHKNQGKAKAEKIPEGWGENKEPVSDGVTFFLKYIGSTLVGEVDSNDSYGDGISAKAICNIIAMAKSAAKKLRKTALTVSSKGITMKDIATGQLMFDLSIYRISFCTADKTHDKVFAYIARNTTNETMECHAFLCAKSKIAQAVTLTVSKAFSVAQEKYVENKKSKRLSKERAIKEKAKKSVNPSVSESTTSSPINNQAPLILLSPMESSQPTFVSSSTENSPVRKIQNNDSKQGWESFDEDSDADNVDDLFSQLAENRIKEPPSLGTDLRADELDDSIQQYMKGGDACYQAFARTQSVDDLLSL